MSLKIAVSGRAPRICRSDVYVATGDATIAATRRCLRHRCDKLPTSAADLAHDPNLQDIVALL